MKIDDYVSGDDSAVDLFTFPHNSKVFDDSVIKLVDQKDYSYAFSYFGVTKGVKSKRNIAINGFFDDTGSGDKEANIQALMKHCNDNKLKKLFFSDSKFYVVIPQTCKVTHSGGRTMYRDYVANFISPFGILFSSTVKDGARTSNEENEGNVFTPIEKIVTTSINASTTYTYQDSNNNGFKFTTGAGVSGTATIYLIKMLDLGSDSFITEYLYVEVNGTKQVVSLATEGKSMLLGLDAGSTITSEFSSSVPTNSTIYFRDGYSSE